MARKSNKNVGSSRYDKYIQKVFATRDIQALKKMLYNRNRSIRRSFEKNNPDIVLKNRAAAEPIVHDARYIHKSTLKRLYSIKDANNMITQLQTLLVDTTRRKNKPTSYLQYSNRERDYLANGVNALTDALESWVDSNLQDKLRDAFQSITMTDMQELFANVPSYWAISEGYFYAVDDFDNFMEGIFTIIERKVHTSGAMKGKPIVKLTAKEKEKLSNLLFSNDPRTIALGGTTQD